MFVLGIDPGLSRCGYGCVQQRGRSTTAVAAGVIRTDPKQALPRRLSLLQTEIRSLIDDYAPDVVAVERVLFQVNVSTAMSVGQASGVAMAEAATAGCEVIEYSPNEIKSAVTGDGAADKHQVETMVKMILGLTKPLRPVDAADAIAVALCHLAQSPALHASGQRAKTPGATSSNRKRATASATTSATGTRR